MGLFENATKVRQIKSIQQAQLTQSGDAYNLGLYNGLELALAILEDRDPAFFMPDNDEEQEQDEEQVEEVKRTVAFGVRRLKS